MSIVNLEDAEAIQALRSSVKNLFPEFIQSAPFGWEVLLKGRSVPDLGKPLELTSELKRCRKIGDLTIERKP